MSENGDRKACLSLEEFKAWALDGRISDERRTHLDGCNICQAVGEKLAEFDPEAGARLVLNTSGSRMSSSARLFSIAVVMTAVTVIVIAVSGWILVERGNQEASARAQREFAAQTRTLDHCQQKINELEQQNKSYEGANRQR